MLVNSNQLSLSINNTEFSISPDTMPTISESSHAIFKELGANSPDNLTSSLKEKASTLVDSINRLQNAEEHKVRNKIFALTRSALTVGIVVGGVFAIAASAIPTAVGIISVAIPIIAYLALSHYNAFSAGLPLNYGSSQGQYGILFTALFGGPFFPIYECFTDIRRKKRIVEKQRQELEVNVSKLVSFFGTNLEGLKSNLQDKISQSEESLKALRNLPIRSSAGEQEMENKKKNYEKAMEELEGGSAFCSQFHS